VIDGRVIGEDVGDSVPKPTEAEVLASIPCGPSESPRSLPAPRPEGLEGALERVLVRALMRPPCLVSFSGGRDSSAILALAAAAARKHDLPLPIPITMRFADAPETGEAEWQERVIDHIGLSDHRVLDLATELDLLGPVARHVLGLVGVRWPANAYMHRSMTVHARGGTLLTGAGGDELLASCSTPMTLSGHVFVRLPHRVKVALWLRGNPVEGFWWLTQRGRKLVQRTLGEDGILYSHEWHESVRYWYGTRVYASLRGVIGLIGAGDDVEVVSPFLEPEVLVELIGAAGIHGFPSRTMAMRRICGGLLPDSVLSRVSKASFEGAVWGPQTRAFARAWDGTGLDTDLVDVEALRRAWLADSPDFRSALTLHAAWSSCQTGSAASS
jgi:Asparagine synthase